MIKNEIDISNYVLDNVKQTILDKKLIQDGDKIIVAVSGGPDSVTLLHILYNLRNEFKEKYNIAYDLSVAHVNHMLREEAEEEKIYVESLCKEYNINFNYLKVDINKEAKKLKMSHEMAGREKRYEFFYSLLKKEAANKIAIAHNFDDNIETILLNIIRGTGLKGLTGMEYISKELIRPLLNVKKCDILLYTKLNNIKVYFDKTNNENIYLRNKIRNMLIPELKDEYNSNIMQNIFRMSQIVKVDDDFLNLYTYKIYEKSIIESGNNYIIFNFEELLKEHTAIINRFVRKLLEDLDKLNGIQNVNIEEISRLMKNNIRGKRYIKAGSFEIVILKKNIAKIFIGEEI